MMIAQYAFLFGTLLTSSKIILAKFAKFLFIV